MMKTPLAIVAVYVMVAAYGLTVTIHEYTPDPRVDNWFLMKRWTPIIMIICSYFLVVMIGPKLMQTRPAYTLRSILKLYNLLQVVISAYMFKEFLFSAWQSSYSLRCQPVDYSNNPLAVRMAAACWWFFFSKIIDTFDTVFFILRKKNSQVTFLHVYHHGSMILNWWLAARFTPGGQVFFQCMINSFVHVVMYSYYFLSAFGPGVQKYLWWKRYLTQLQLIQFCAIIGHLIIGMSTTCEFPFVLNCFVIVYCITLLALFTNFYMETYRHQSRDREAAAAAAALMAKIAAANGHANGSGTATIKTLANNNNNNNDDDVANTVSQSKRSSLKNGVILNSTYSNNGNSTTQVYQRR